MIRYSAWSTAFVALLMCVALPPTPQANWPMFQKNIAHSGITAQDGAESDSVAWYFPVAKPDGWDEDVIWASPIINPAGTKVYMATRFGRLYCLNLADGDSLWARDLPGGISGTPALANGSLYVLAEGDRSLYCLDAANGDSIWATELGETWQYCAFAQWMESSTAVVGDSVLYVGSRDGRTYCLYTNNGDMKWQSDSLGTYIASSPAYHNHRVYVGATTDASAGSGLYCLDESDGSTIWYYTYTSGNAGGTGFTSRQ
jgi:outer membrane protein assembly factor BamB